MSRSDGLQPPRERVTGTRKNDPNPLKFSSTSERDIQTTEEDYALDDDFMSGPARSNSSIIRRASLPLPRNATPASTPVPQRRTGGQLAQSTSSFANPYTTQPYPRNTTRKVPSPSTAKSNVHWLLPVGIGMIAMLVLWEVGTLALSWSLARYDDIRYGNPRTYQTNFVVGHGDSPDHPSHFIAVNLNRQAMVVEFPAGNPSGAQSYIVPYYILGQGGDLTPITLEFKDVTNDGKVDMIIHIHLQTQDQTFVFVNDGNKFRAPTNKDNIHL